MEKSFYDSFIEKYSDFPQQLAQLIAKERDALPKNEENSDYNAGTMQKDADIGLAEHIVIANAHQFQKSYDVYKQEVPLIKEEEAKARVVFDFLQREGGSFSYEQNKNDILFGNITREQFYAQAIYEQVLQNTNFFDRHVGHMQILALELKGEGTLPRNTEGLSQQDKDNFQKIAPLQKLDILYKRGLYHESIHMAMGTTDERKCDTYALLKIMKEYPQFAQIIYNIYNQQRAKIGYTVKEMHQSRDDEARYKRAIKTGTMTYLMPETYKKLGEYAKNPEKIPENDTDILTLTCQITAGCEFSSKQLAHFHQLMKQDIISIKDLEKDDVVKACMEQGKYKNIQDYINDDSALKEVFEKRK